MKRRGCIHRISTFEVHWTFLDGWEGLQENQGSSMDAMTKTDRWNKRPTWSNRAHSIEVVVSMKA